MATTIGNEYDHITISDGTNQTVHYLKDTVARADISDLKSAFETDFGIQLSVNPDMVDNKLIDGSNGNLTSDSNFAITAPIPIKAGQTIKLNAAGYRTVVGMIATCNSDNTSRTVVVRSTDSTKKVYSYTALVDGYVVCSVGKSLGYSIEIAVDYFEVKSAENLLNFFEEGDKSVSIINQINNYFLDNSGRLSSQSGWFITQSITLYRGQTISVYTAGYSTSIGIINIYDSVYDNYTPVVICVDGTDRTYTYTATETCIIRCTIQKGHTNNVFTITSPSDLLGTIIKIEDEINAQKINYPQFFDNILCIGDSLTIGLDVNGILTKNYPHFFGKLAQAETEIVGHSGYTTKQVWDNDFSSLSGLSNYDCAIIYLGTNGGLTDTVDTDCDAEDYTQNADTNTGCYGKIIGKIKADAPNCKIFCVAGVADYVRRNTTMNPAVRSLAEFYEVGLIDVENCLLTTQGYTYTVQRYRYQPVDAIHYNALGYLTLANLFYDEMNKYMKNHLDKYK